jgi:hypothetical protein
MKKLQLNEHKRHARDLAESLREKDKADLRLLRARINAARVARKNMLHLARLQCRDARVSLKDRQAEERTELRAAHIVERVQGKSACETGKRLAKEHGTGLELTAKERLAQERRDQKLVREADRRPMFGATKKTTARERAQEDDDSVRSNLPPELVPVFNTVVRKLKFKATPKRSRTEAFLDWAEENPGEILAVQEANAEQMLKRLLKESRALGGEMRKATRYKQSAEELEALLAAVPF